VISSKGALINAVRWPLPTGSKKVSVLQRHRSRQLEERVRFGAGYDDHDLVFASEIGTPFLHGNLVRRHFKPILERAGLPSIRLYDLRHTGATLPLSADIDPKVVSERHGRASVVLTLDTYSHVLPTIQGQATGAITRLIGK